MNPRCLSALMTLCLAIAAPLAAADYRYVKFNYPGAPSTHANGINARGDIVGRYVDAGGVSHGFLRRKGVFSSIDVPDAVATDGARAINARGDIVGNYEDAEGGHGFLLSGGQFSHIHVPGSTATFARGINNAGDITGHFENAAGVIKGFILKDGTYYTVRVPGSDGTEAFGIRDNGRVVVGRTGLGVGLRGFVRNRPGDYELIDFPGSAGCTGATATNQRGEIVGGFCSDDFPLLGFVLRAGQFTRIEFPGAGETFPLGINDDGVIVGRITLSNGAERGFKAVPQE